MSLSEPLRQIVRQRAGNCCEYCLGHIKNSWDFDKKPTTPDDLIPLVSWLE